MARSTMLIKNPKLRVVDDGIELATPVDHWWHSGSEYGDSYGRGSYKIAGVLSDLVILGLMSQYHWFNAPI